MAKPVKRGGKQRLEKTNILIAVEGETEEKYINELKTLYKLNTVSIKVKNVKGGSAMAIYDVAKKEHTYSKKSKETQFEEVYCVFDNDNKNMQTEIFPAVVNMLKDDFKVIYSNMCFEMWLSMHYSSFIPKNYSFPEDAKKDLLKFESKFDKTKFDVDFYMSNAQEAVKKSKALISKNVDFPKTVTELSVNPYTNMAKLIERFEEEKNK